MGIFSNPFREESEEERIRSRIKHLERLANRGNVGAMAALSLYRNDPEGSGKYALFNDGYLSQ